jgi:hypothetical protein
MGRGVAANGTRYAIWGAAWARPDAAASGDQRPVKSSMPHPIQSYVLGHAFLHCFIRSAPPRRPGWTERYETVTGDAVHMYTGQDRMRRDAVMRTDTDMRRALQI